MKSPGIHYFIAYNKVNSLQLPSILLTCRFVSDINHHMEPSTAVPVSHCYAISLVLDTHNKAPAARAPALLEAM